LTEETERSYRVTNITNIAGKACGGALRKGRAKYTR